MLVDKETAARRIATGEPLVLAGDAEILSRLPLGRWIGGSIPYFMADRGTTSREQIFVTPLPGSIERVEFMEYDGQKLNSLLRDAPDNGYTVLILPYGTNVHERFAHDAPEYEHAFIKPVVGWVSGTHLDDLGVALPQVFNGTSGQSMDDLGVAAHVTLSRSEIAEVGTVNLFTQGTGDDITFDEQGFEIRECYVNGKREHFARYLKRINADIRWPMVANYAGTQINVSFQRLDAEADLVKLYAPVFRHVTYRLAARLDRAYASVYAEAVRGVDFPFTCSCVLNYLHGNLEGHPVTGAHGPATFGEIANQLLNQTTVYLKIHATS
ncbi:MAG TPA: hypothetical protein VIV60_17225 [Polyangiaceae bacterium]